MLREPEVSGEWHRRTSPEGRPYFWHERLVRIASHVYNLLITSPQNLYTNVYVFGNDFEPEDSYKVSLIVDAADHLRQKLNEAASGFKHVALDKSELVVDVLEDCGMPYCAYYFANSEHRTIFWMRDVSLNVVAPITNFSVRSAKHLSTCPTV